MTKLGTEGEERSMIDQLRQDRRMVPSQETREGGRGDRAVLESKKAGRKCRDLMTGGHCRWS